MRKMKRTAGELSFALFFLLLISPCVSFVNIQWPLETSGNESVTWIYVLRDESASLCYLRQETAAPTKLTNERNSAKGGGEGGDLAMN